MKDDDIPLFHKELGVKYRPILLKVDRTGAPGGVFRLGRDEIILDGVHDQVLLAERCLWLHDVRMTVAPVFAAPRSWMRDFP